MMSLLLEVGRAILSVAKVLTRNSYLNYKLLNGTLTREHDKWHYLYAVMGHPCISCVN